jgi:hypothetical protein
MRRLGGLRLPRASAAACGVSRRTARLRGPSLSALLLAIVVMPALAGPVRAVTPVSGAAAGVSPGSPQIWTMNLYRDGAVRWQNPDWRACTAAATMSMLNLIAYSTDEVMPPHEGAAAVVSLRWHVDTSYGRQEDILSYERDHMTTGLWADGTDPHGWRNALNWYGWGSLKAGVYRDAAINTFEDAAWRVVVAIARTHKPVGILAWSGSHAQFVTGYQVTGSDPRVSDNFTVVAVYITDPWEPDWVRNHLIPYSVWRNGPATVRFAPYWQTDYTGRDPIDGQIGYKEWRGKYVIEEPIS